MLVLGVYLRIHVPAGGAQVLDSSSRKEDGGGAEFSVSVSNSAPSEGRQVSKNGGGYQCPTPCEVFLLCQTESQ